MNDAIQLKFVENERAKLWRYQKRCKGYLQNENEGDDQVKEMTHAMPKQRLICQQFSVSKTMVQSSMELNIHLQLERTSFIFTHSCSSF